MANQFDAPWRRVVFASDLKDCSGCGEKLCVVCKMHYADCQCPGPTMDEFDYEEDDEGVLYAKPK